MHRSIAAATLAALLLFPCRDALGTAQRTFVSAATGADANASFNCSIAMPCRGFTTAITVTAANGEIVVLDSGGYGPVTIDKSVTIAAPTGVYAGISVLPFNNGVDILTDNLTVVLRGLTINGQGGTSGVKVFAVNVRLRIEHCVIANLVGLGSFGIDVRNTGGHLSVKDTVIRDNDVGIEVSGGSAVLARLQVEGSFGFGIRLKEVQASISESTISGNGSAGLRADSYSAADVVVAISDSSITGNGGEGVIAYANGSKNVLLAFTRSTISANAGDGVEVLASGTGAVRAEITESTVKSNMQSGLSIGRLGGAAASVLTASGNLISGNGGPGIAASGTDIYAIASRNTITMNTGVGLQQGFSAVVESSGDNVVRGNNFGAAQTTGTITPIIGI